MGERRWLISSTIGVKIAVDYGKVRAPLALCQNGLITIKVITKIKSGEISHFLIDSVCDWKSPKRAEFESTK